MSVGVAEIFTYFCLGFDHQLVALDEIDQLADILLEEFLALRDIGKVFVDEFAGRLGEGRAAVLVGKVRDAQGVARVKLRLQEVTTAIDNLHVCVCVRLKKGAP